MKKKIKQKTIRLSPSALNLFRDCPRCFWMDKKIGVKRPRGIFPSLPSGMDRVIKDYFDAFRKQQQMPPEFKDKSFDGLGLYPDQYQLDLWREWRTGPSFTDEDGSILFGAIDDLMTFGDGYVPFDYKTKGSPTTARDAERYYQNQIDCYAFLLESNGLKQSGFGYLLYYSPKTVSEKGWVKFFMQAVRLETNTSRALKTFRNAVELIRSDTPPEAASCEYCEWICQHQDLDFS